MTEASDSSAPRPVAKPSWARKVLRALGFALLVVLAALGFRIYRVYAPPLDPRPLPAGLVALESDLGRRMLADREPSADLERLRRALRPQIHGSFCGVASGVTALNALGAGPFEQSTFLDTTTPDELEVFFGGMTLDELGAVVRAHGARVRLEHASEGGLAAFRARARANLARPDDVLVVNYFRPTLEQEGGGHFSPVAAYDPHTDRLLVLDTASYKYPPVWVSVERLFASMNTVDPDSRRTRGYAEIALEH